MTTNDLGQGMLQNTIPLLFGHPDPATLFPPELHQAMQRLISSPRASIALQYGPEQGTQSLIDVLVAKINREQGLSLRPDNLMIVAGSTHAVDMLARLYAGPSGVMLVEAPTYADSIHIFRDLRIELYSIPTDESGLIPGELEKKGSIAKIERKKSYHALYHSELSQPDRYDAARRATPRDYQAGTPPWLLDRRG